MSFSPRLSAPSTTNKCYIHTSYGGYNSCIRIKGNSVLPNCVGYAWGRAREILGSTPKLSRGNAETWYGFSDGYSRGKTPKLGAIIVWAKGRIGNSKDGAGHIAVVEQIHSNGSFTVSQSGYTGKKRFWTSTIPKSGYLKGYRFLGFIYLPISISSSSSSSSSSSIKVGGTYTLRANMKVRTGAGTGYRWKKRSELTANARAHAQNQTYAVLKKGTKVTCLAIKGNWMKIPSGWVCIRSGSTTYIS